MLFNVNRLGKQAHAHIAAHKSDQDSSSRHDSVRVKAAQEKIELLQEMTGCHATPRQF
jgi:hypothetical protein